MIGTVLLSRFIIAHILSVLQRLTFLKIPGVNVLLI